MSSQIVVNALLVIDDDLDETTELRTRFESQGTIVLTAKDDQQARQILSRVPCLDVVILDLFLDGSSVNQAKIVLKDIEENHMVPVFIYTKHSGEGSLTSPNIMGTLTKSDSVEKVQEQIAKLLTNAKFIRIALSWARSVSSATHRALVDLMPEWAKEGEYNNTLSLLLAGLRSDRRMQLGESDPELEAFDLIDILMHGLQRRIVQDHDLITTISSAIADAGLPDFEEEGDYWKFRDLIQYAHPGKEISTGDIFMHKKDGSFLVIISPQCDLVDRAEEFLSCLRAVRLREFLREVRGDKAKRMSILHNRTARYHSLAAGNDSDRSFVVDFASVLTVKRANLGITEEFTKIATILSPFRANLMQRYVSYVNRTGTPDVPKEILERLHDVIMNEK